MTTMKVQSCLALSLLSLPLLAQTESAPSGGLSLQDMKLSVNRSSLLQEPVKDYPPLWESGPFSLFTSAAYEFRQYQDLPYTAGKLEDTNKQSVSANLGLQMGPQWSIAYTPSWNWYSNDKFRDSTGQRFKLNGKVHNEAWYVTFNQDYLRRDETQLETAEQTMEDLFGTNLSIAHPFTSRLSMDLDLNQQLRFPEEGSLSRTWKGQAWGNFNITPQLQTSLGLAFSYFDVDPGINSSSDELHARATWKASDKLYFSGTIGRENRNFDTSDIEDKSTNLYSLSASYLPFEQTQIILSAQQSVRPSLTVDSIERTQGESVEVRQRILGYFQLGLGYHKNTSDYFYYQKDDRSDDIDLWTAWVEMPVTGRGSLRLSYSYTEVDSTQTIYNRSTPWYGASFSLHF